uniref:Cytochrome c oxidase subunit 2 n=1 Tax=Panagrolaimus sp. PS1159 TaxID=55785 RepID=A0AC35FN43_9BILA
MSFRLLLFDYRINNGPESSLSNYIFGHRYQREIYFSKLLNNYFQGYNLNFSNSLFSSYIDWFHSFNSRLIIGVLLFVTSIFIYLVFSNYYFKSKKIEYQFGELLCSVFPTVILLVQIVPSLSLLYYYGLINIDRQVSVKVTGHQWYWSYEVGDIPGLEFDSYIKSLDQLNYGDPRLLEVDNRCVIPIDTNIRFYAIRGVLRILRYNFPVIGVFYGQCSEICGANHSFIPIALEVTLFDSFKS